MNTMTDKDSNKHGDIQENGNFKEHQEFISQLQQVIQPAKMVNFDQKTNNVLVLECELASKALNTTHIETDANWSDTQTDVFWLS